MRQRAALILSLVVLLAGAGGVAGWRWWHGRPPFGPAALGARATLELVDQATADAALEPVNAMAATDPGDQILLGSVSWTPPPGSPERVSLRIVLLDERRRLLPGFIAVTAPDPEHVSTGWDGSLDLAQQRYPWLRGVGTRESGGVFWTAGSVISVSSVAASPVTFQTVLRVAHPGTPPEQQVATAPVAVADMVVALICVGPDEQVYWAQRLPH